MKGGCVEIEGYGRGGFVVLLLHVGIGEFNRKDKGKCKNNQ